ELMKSLAAGGSSPAGVEERDDRGDLAGDHRPGVAPGGEDVGGGLPVRLGQCLVAERLTDDEAVVLLGVGDEEGWAAGAGGRMTGCVASVSGLTVRAGWRARSVSGCRSLRPLGATTTKGAAPAAKAASRRAGKPAAARSSWVPG